MDWAQTFFLVFESEELGLEQVTHTATKAAQSAPAGLDLTTLWFLELDPVFYLKINLFKEK